MVNELQKSSLAGMVSELQKASSAAMVNDLQKASWAMTKESQKVSLA